MSRIAKSGKKAEMNGLVAAVRELEQVKQQAKALGIFTDDRALLECPSCGLLFQRERTVITKHIRNLLEEGELAENSVCANYAQTAADGKTYQTVYYNLDVIISVGYRVKSRRGTEFRIWAT